MAFVDYSIFVIARDVLSGRQSVTVTLNGEFVGTALASATESSAAAR